MQHEKILRRNDGSQIKIEVSFHSSTWNADPSRWNVAVQTRGKGAKVWRNVHSTDDYFWRRLNNEERRAYEHQLHILHATEEEILAAKLELWESFKPTLKP